MAQQIEQFHQDVQPAVHYLNSRGIDDSSIERFKLGYDRATGRLVIPYLSPAGPWFLKRRCIEDHDCKELGHAKYINDPGADLRLFNAGRLRTADEVLVCEGEVDTVLAEQAGIPAVGYPGAQQWSVAKNSHWGLAFDNCSRIVIVADGDEPGHKAAQQVASRLRAAVVAEIKVVNMPTGHDTSSYIAAFGEVDFMNRVGFL